MTVIQFGDNIQYSHASYAMLFLLNSLISQLLLINYVCYFLRYRVTYFQRLCYLALLLCIVNTFDTLCVFFSFVFLYIFYTLFLKLQFMQIKMHYV